MEPEKPLIQGILLLPPQGMLGQLKKTWHKRFCQLFKASNYGIERVEIYDNHEEAILQLHSPRIITLEACVKITPSNQSHVFTVVTKTGIHYFGCYSESDMRNWITAFQSVAFKDKLSSQIIEENSDLYCTNGEGVFSVKVIETDASIRCGLEARYYTLVVAAVDIKLLDGDIVLFTWPYRYIRRYGYKDGKFIFEAGRKCESGEGSFRLEHTSQKEIFRCISLKMKSMKKMLNGENSPSIECNDAQYHAALSMEAGSRSPLPPSPKASTNLIDVDFSTISQNSQKQQNSSSSAESNPFVKPLPPIIKPKPAKPPRKYVFTPLSEKKSADSEFVDSPTSGDYRPLNQGNSPELSHKSTESSVLEEEEKHPYDLVEVRNDAWKTHGIDSIHHTERINITDQRSNENKRNNHEDCQYETMMPLLTSQSSCNVNEPVMFISPTSHANLPCKANDESDYDRLQNFGSAVKVAHKPGYKISKDTHSTSSQGAFSAPPVTESNATWCNYDIVEDMTAVRLADDSHLGYGIIRKKANPPEPTSVNTSTVPKQKVFNDSEYAIVSKPKRV